MLKPITTGRHISMGRTYALILGILLATHGGVGLFVEGEHMLAMFNTDILIDIVYLVFAVALLIVGFAPDDEKQLRGVLAFVGLVFVGIGLAGLADETVFGLLPTGLTWVDLLLFFVAGGGALISAVAPRTAEPLMTGGERVVG
jgi:hypothetical protein